MKKIITVVLTVLLVFSTFSIQAFAKEVTYAPYEGYEYNDYNESVAAPIGYIMDGNFNSDAMGLEVEIKEPSDILFDGEDAVYILDSGNGRILELTTTFRVVKIYDEFLTELGDIKKIKGAQGLSLSLDKSCFYIANTQQCEVLKVRRSDSRVLQCITKPEDLDINTNADFAATKVTVDNKGQVYVLVKSINVGAFVFDADGEFLKFFGSNPIVATAETLRNYLLKRFMTKEQRKGLTRITPTAFSNFDVDEYGFLYTVSEDTSLVSKEGTVRRLNYSGNDILKSGLVFGDLEWDRLYGTVSKYTSFIDIDIDEDGYINLLDKGRGKVFQYTTDGKMTAVFGSYNDLNGSFKNPVAIETIGTEIYVLDAGSNTVISFKPTDYTTTLRSAFSLLQSTDTKASKEVWTEILKMNTNSQYAYYGLGTVADQEGNYTEAMKNFKLAGAHQEYSKSLREYRKEFISDNYILIILALVVIAVLVIILVRIIKKKSVLVHGTAYSAMETKALFPVYTSLHPADGFGQFRIRDVMSVRATLIIVVSWFLIKTLAFFNTGFAFNNNRAIDYSFFTTLFFTAGLFILFVVSNWSVCTLLNGKGNFKTIVVTTAYSLIPYLLCEIVKIGMSNILTLEESAFIGLVGIIGLLWSGMILFIGLSTIHEYSFKETVGSVLLTILFMALICFLLILFYTLIQQTVNFVRSAIAELSLR
ncbi:MAG: YIP1 family protein [Clostridia bacterium]|nr:YIP1 family protein [Clostridia bacterium]